MLIWLNSRTMKGHIGYIVHAGHVKQIKVWTDHIGHLGHAVYQTQLVSVRKKWSLLLYRLSNEAEITPYIISQNHTFCLLLQIYIQQIFLSIILAAHSQVLGNFWPMKVP